MNRSKFFVLVSAGFLFPFFLCPVLSLAQRKISKREMKFRLEKTDTDDVYSRNPKRPFRYGYDYDKAECLYHFNQISELYDLHEGDVIADVGAASGWVDGALSVICDSITFYVEDIDTDYLNEDQFTRVISHFNQVRGNPQTNVLHYVIGTKTKTNLPDATFDKIIIDNAFHEIKKPRRILADIRKKLKPDGVLIIYDEFSSPFTKRWADGCDTKVKTVLWLNNLAEKKGFYLYDRKAPKNAFNNILFFSKKPTKGESHGLYYISRKYDWYIQRIDELKTVVDTSYIQKIFSSLLPEKEKIKSVYPLLNEYFAEMIFECLIMDRVNSALSIGREALKMYPDDEIICADYADACEEAGCMEESLKYYEMAAKLSNKQSIYDDDIKRVKESIGKK